MHKWSHLITVSLWYFANAVDNQQRRHPPKLCPGQTHILTYMNTLDQQKVRAAMFAVEVIAIC